MKYVSLALGWAFGLFFLLIGVMVLVTPPFISLSGLFLLVIGLIIFPPFRKFLASKGGFELSTKSTAISALLLFMAFGFLSGVERETAEREKAQEEALAAKEALEEKRKAVVEEFSRNKEKILAEIRALHSEGKFSQALEVSNKYGAVNDPQLNEARRLAKAEVQRVENERRTQLILEQLNGIPVENYEENLKLYRQLVSMHPENDEYESKVDFYSGKLAEKERIAKEAEERRTKIRTQFSAWDGSHHALERLIKQTMHNPDSYEHVETTYGDRGDHLVVRTVFRGTNGFGAVVKDSLSAKVSLDGQIFEIIE